MNIKDWLWAFPCLFFIGGYLLIAFFIKSDPFSMPSLIGLSLHDACVTLTEHNLNGRIMYQKDDPDFDDGTVLQQKPFSSQKVRAGQSVFLVISRKPKNTRAPGYLGLSRSDIVSHAQKSGIKLKFFLLPSHIPTSVCIAQLPNKDDELHEKNMILYISEGSPSLCIMPSLYNKTLHEVEEFCLRYGMRYTIHEIGLEHGSNKNRVVVGQRPLAGSFITTTCLPVIHIQLQEKVV